jgi:pyruvate ferredoxin oxidoreductase alpha subunit
VGVPEVYTEAKKQCEQALLDAKAVVEEVFGQMPVFSGRKYKLVERNGKAKAKTLFVTMGSLGESAMTAVEGLNAKKEDVGQVRIRLWRPFPVKEFLAACRGAKRLIVIDRAISPGSVCGPVAQEIKSVFYGHKDAPEIVNVIAGLGGRDVPVGDFQEMYRLAKKGNLEKTYTLWGLDSNA